MLKLYVLTTCKEMQPSQTYLYFVLSRTDQYIHGYLYLLVRCSFLPLPLTDTRWFWKKELLTKAIESLTENRRDFKSIDHYNGGAFYAQDCAVIPCVSWSRTSSLLRVAMMVRENFCLADTLAYYHRICVLRVNIRFSKLKNTHFHYSGRGSCLVI